MSEEFSAILNHFELRLEDCEQAIESSILDEISLKCCKDWKFLSSLLELEDTVVWDIDHKPVDEKEKRREFFREWKQRKGFRATYERLIRALLKYERQQDAEKVCELLCGSLQASLTATVYHHAPAQQPPSATIISALTYSQPPSSAGHAPLQSSIAPTAALSAGHSSLQPSLTTTSASTHNPDPLQPSSVPATSSAGTSSHSTRQQGT